MRLPEKVQRCLACESDNAYATGLCRRCYARFRYHEAHRSPEDAIMERIEQFCDKCCVPMECGAIEASNGARARMLYMETWYCSKCGFSKSVPPK